MIKTEPIKGFDPEHGIICVLCSEKIQADDLIVPVYRAFEGRDLIFGPKYIKGSTNQFSFFAHLRCQR